MKNEEIICPNCRQKEINREQTFCSFCYKPFNELTPNSTTNDEPVKKFYRVQFKESTWLLVGWRKITDNGKTLSIGYKSIAEIITEYSIKWLILLLIIIAILFGLKSANINFFVTNGETTLLPGFNYVIGLFALFILFNLLRRLFLARLVIENSRYHLHSLISSKKGSISELKSILINHEISENREDNLYSSQTSSQSHSYHVYICFDNGSKFTVYNHYSLFGSDFNEASKLGRQLAVRLDIPCQRKTEKTWYISDSSFDD